MGLGILVGEGVGVGVGVGPDTVKLPVATVSASHWSCQAVDTKTHAIRKSEAVSISFSLFIAVSLCYFHCASHDILFLMLYVLDVLVLPALMYHIECYDYQNSGSANNSYN